jgi:hypothetical protein
VSKEKASKSTDPINEKLKRQESIPKKVKKKRRKSSVGHAAQTQTKLETPAYWLKFLKGSKQNKTRGTMQLSPRKLRMQVLQMYLEKIKSGICISLYIICTRIL